MPCGKISNGKHYSIITDHLGTPIEAYNQEGELIWEREQDLYGNSRQGFAKENFRCPFKYQGQYYDPEVELCYNRFRYYHPETGRYISEDPIGFLSGEPNFFAYVSDTNAWVDLLGLSYEEVREVQKGEKILDLIREAKRETFLEGKEYAVIKRKDGKRYLVSGDKGKIILPEDTIIIYGHTHPFNTSINNGPSQEDRLSLDLVNDGKGQSKQYVFHNGLRTTIYRGTDSSADVTIQAND